MQPPRTAVTALRRQGLRLILFLLLLSLPVSCRHERPATERAPLAPLTDIHDMEALRTLFNRDAGVPRLVLLLSPT